MSSVDNDGNVIGGTIVQVPYCQSCYQKRVTRGKTLCIDCQQKDLTLSLLSRDDSQRREEFRSPVGHTLPNVTVPLMQGNMQSMYQSQVIQPVISQQNPIPSQESPLVDIRQKIEDLKKNLYKN